MANKYHQQSYEMRMRAKGWYPFRKWIPNNQALAEECREAIDKLILKYNKQHTSLSEEEEDDEEFEFED